MPGLSKLCGGARHATIANAAEDTAATVLAAIGDIRGEQATFDVPLWRGAQPAAEESNPGSGPDSKPIELVMGDCKTSAAVTEAEAMLEAEPANAAWFRFPRWDWCSRQHRKRQRLGKCLGLSSRHRRGGLQRSYLYCEDNTRPARVPLNGSWPAQERTLDRRWRPKKRCESVGQTVEIRLRSNF